MFHEMFMYYGCDEILWHKISRDPTCLARTWWYPCNNIRHSRVLFPELQWFSYVYCNCFTSRVSVDREKHVLSLPMLMNKRVGHHHASDVNAVIHWYGLWPNTRCSCSTDAYDVKQMLKTFCIHAAAGPERATQSFQPHIIISVLQTFK